MFTTNLLFSPMFPRQTTSPFRRKILRLREKYVLLVSILLFCAIVYSAFVFLPDGSRVVEDNNRSQRNRYPDLKKGVLDIVRNPHRLVIPPFQLDNASSGGFRPLAHDNEAGDPHKQDDANRLKMRVSGDNSFPQLRAPKLAGAESPSAIPEVATETATEPQSDDQINTRRRDKIKEMIMWAWDGYAQYAWGANEIRSVSKVPHSGSIFGPGNIGATIVDAMDTLYVAGLLDRFDAGKKWIELSLSWGDQRGDLSVFETNIRYVGGFLACFALTKDELFKRKAAEIADLLLPAFDTPTGIPLAMVNIKTKQGKNWGWASGGASILSEFGTLQLEFEYLSEITGNPTYVDKVRRIRQVLKEIDKPSGLYPNYLNPKTGKWGSSESQISYSKADSLIQEQKMCEFTGHTSLGALGDSFYEYLLKSWLITGKRDTEAKQMYDEAVKTIGETLVQRSKNGLVYLAEMKGSRLDHKMDHLACFVGGMYGLQGQHEDDADKKQQFLQLAQDITHTCHESYIRADTHLGPESFRFTNEFEAITINDREKYYILRPEVIEAYFYMWRITKDPKYRDWAWDAAEAIETHCKADAGYSGIRNVYNKNVAKDDVQQSFFLAETLKYLFLIFSNDDVLSLDQWVFNTEAHPLPVRLTGPPNNGSKVEPGFRVERR